MRGREFFQRLLELVELERQESMAFHYREIRQLTAKQREQKGRTITGLRARRAGKALGGRVLVRLYREGKDLPETEITVGDVVLICPENRTPDPQRDLMGTVARMARQSLVVMLDRLPGKLAGRWRVDLYSNEITFQRMEAAIQEIARAYPHTQRLRALLLGEEEPEFGETEGFSFFNPRLNESQREAVRRALAARDIFLIHGPPGTGKTTTCAEVVAQFARKGKKVLACADSNVAVDNLMEALLRIPGLRVLRVGHPARVMKHLLQHTLDYRVEQDPRYPEIARLLDEIQEWRSRQAEYTPPTAENRRGLTDQQIRRLARRGESARGLSPGMIQSMAKWLDIQNYEIQPRFQRIRELEEEIVFLLLAQANVVCTTNSGAGAEVLRNWEFDVVVIDEATQATEPSCYIPMVKGKTYILAGDHKQLGPTVLSEEARRRGLGRSLFERWMQLYPPERISRMLTLQYRMHEKLIHFPSLVFYGGRVRSAPSVARRTLREAFPHLARPQVADLPEDLVELLLSEEPLIFIDTLGQFAERQRAESFSRENPGEAQLLTSIVRLLLQAGVPPEQIGVIAPYRDMVDLLRKQRPDPAVEVHTVDGFQGREKEVILLSTVRSNPRQELGFLTDLRRLNVSITRARVKLIVVGDPETLVAHPVYEQWLTHIRREAGYYRLARVVSG